ncbi:MAG TPA: O-antigen ligase family protein [Pirellulales bacterium]|jgi:hypothetical protein|nr:O-antigen ligase family protein [Pirellulales bacterium]
MRAQRKTSTTKHAAKAAPVPAPEWARPALLGALATLVVARPLLPSEGVSWLGDGQPFDLLWLLLAVCYLLWITFSGGPVRRWNAVDVAVGAFFALCVLSSVAGGRFGNPRTVMNMLWESVSMALVFMLVRQLLRREAEERAVVALMIALAVAMTGSGFYQVFVSLPADRAAYAADPDAVLRSAGQWFPPGSPERTAFEYRLQSTEPLATFALTNSLAGFLTPWLVAALGIALGTLLRRREPATTAGDGTSRRWSAPARSLGLGACIVAMTACLVLTKSRSAYAALIVGIALLPWCGAGYRRVVNWKLVVGVVAALTAIIVAAVAVRGLDAPVLTEATKSLGYRLEYWRATLAMIAQHPWLGVGPGNFQDFYTQYKLPEASEEIRDPHNFLLEVWASSGTFALLALCVALGGLAWRAWRWPVQVNVESISREPATSRATVFLLTGLAAGFVLAFLVAPLVGMAFSEGQGIGGLALAAVALVVWWPWVRVGQLPPRLPAIALAALAINLLAAGGIAYPGVATSFWVLAALVLNRTDPRWEPATALPANLPHGIRARLPRAALLVLVCLAALACYWFSYGPVVRSHRAMAEAQQAQAAGAQPAMTELFWLEATDEDPFIADPWLAIAQLELARVRQRPADAVARQRFVNATEQLGELRPHSSATFRLIGRWYTELYELTADKEAARSAVTAYQRAVLYYPNLASLRGEYAEALERLGQASNARRQAAMALALDGQTPHADKKLSAGLRQRLESLAAER